MTEAAQKYKKFAVAQNIQGMDVSLNPADGNVFQVENAIYVHDPGGFSLVVHNLSGKWINVVIDVAGGQVLETGHIPNGQDGSLIADMRLLINRENKVTRWRPGFLNVPGNGGGEVWFRVPAENGSASLELTVIG